MLDVDGWVHLGDMGHWYGMTWAGVALPKPSGLAFPDAE